MNATVKPSWDTLSDQAALWYAQLDSGSADQKAFEAWRDADPAHAAAFARIAATAEVMDGLRGVDHSADPDLRNAKPITRRNLLPWAAGFVAVAGGTGMWGASQARASASTAVGGRKTITLPDGGRLDLNTDTKASWEFDRTQRRIWLERGEIALAVPADPRPCLLYASKQTITFVAGALNARLRNTAVDVTVTKGTCSVQSQAGAAVRPTRQIRAGEAVLSAPDIAHVRRLSDSDLLFTSAWTRGELVLQGQTLGTAVSEYNRYLDSKIVIADPELASIRLGGRFLTQDPTDFLASLQASFGIHVQRLGNGGIVLTK